MYGTIIPNLFRIFHVELLMHRVIELGCISTRPHMKKKAQLWFFFKKPLKKFRSLNNIRKSFLFKVGKLVFSTEVINQYDFVKAFIVQVSNKATSNETGRPGNYYTCIFLHAKIS